MSSQAGPTQSLGLQALALLLLSGWSIPALATSEAGESNSSSREEPRAWYWAQGEPRWFASGRIAAGLGTGRLGGALGYGKPHWIWAGLDAIGMLTPSATMAAVGIQANAIVGAAAVYVRHSRAFTHDRLTVQSSYDSTDLDPVDSALGYRNLEARLFGTIPVSRWLVSYYGGYTKILGEPANVALYEEMERVVVRPAGLLAVKLIPLYGLGGKRDWYLGTMAEYLRLLDRPSPHVVRLGPACRATLSDHVGFELFLALPVLSPDRLGPMAGLFGTVSLVYQFASGERSSAWPWQ